MLFRTKVEKLMLRQIPSGYLQFHMLQELSLVDIRVKLYLIDRRPYSSGRQDSFAFENIEVGKSFQSSQQSMLSN